MDRFLKSLNYATDVIEIVVAIALVLLAGGLMVSLGLELWRHGVAGLDISTSEFNSLVGKILEIFILVELFRIAIAYMRHENVIPTVLEAALVAVARKFVVFEGAESYLQTAGGLSMLLLAVAVSWWLLSRAEACHIND